MAKKMLYLQNRHLEGDNYTNPRHFPLYKKTRIHFLFTIYDLLGYWANNLFRRREGDLQKVLISSSIMSHEL